jgi:hypothetical protein
MALVESCDGHRLRQFPQSLRQFPLLALPTVDKSLINGPYQRGERIALRRVNLEEEMMATAAKIEVRATLGTAAPIKPVPPAQLLERTQKLYEKIAALFHRDFENAGTSRSC